MPAPTALLKTSAEAAPANVPLPEPDRDEELLLDASSIVPSDASILQPVSNDAEDTEMVVDEEGRPRFAPGKDVVWCLSQRHM
jgi:RNA-binding protein PNO1